METATIYAIVIGILTILGSASVWKYLENRARVKEEQDNYVKYDCRDRITKLEALLEKSADEKDSMRETILELTAIVAELRVKVEFMEMENRRLAPPPQHLSDDTPTETPSE